MEIVALMLLTFQVQMLTVLPLGNEEMLAVPKSGFFPSKTEPPFTGFAFSGDLASFLEAV